MKGGLLKLEGLIILKQLTCSLTTDPPVIASQVLAADCSPTAEKTSVGWRVRSLSQRPFDHLQAAGRAAIDNLNRFANGQRLQLTDRKAFLDLRKEQLPVQEQDYW